MKTPESVWQQVLDTLQQQVTRPNFSTWLEPLRPVALEGDTLVLVGTSFAEEWFHNRLGALAARTISQILGPQAQIRFLDADEPLARAVPGLHDDDDEDEERSESDLRHHHLQRHDGVLAQLKIWAVLDATEMLERYGNTRVRAAMRYVKSRRNVGNPGGYLRRMVEGDEEIPEPISWVAA